MNRLSFTVARNECFGLLGINGAGKSTTFSMIVADSQPDEGQVWLEGHYNTENLDQYRRNLGYDPQLEPQVSLSPREALSLMADLRIVPQTDTTKLLTILNMQEHSDKPATKLSGGTRRKLALGMSVVGSPALLALDEPTAGIDPMARRSIWQLLRSLRALKGSSVVISSHAMEECEAICDRIGIMANGHLRCIGSFLQLRNKFARGLRIKIEFGEISDNIVEAANELARRLQLSLGVTFSIVDTGVNNATLSVTDVEVRRSKILELLQDFSKSHPRMRYVINDSSLEDIFITIAQEQQGEQMP